MSITLTFTSEALALHVLITRPEGVLLRPPEVSTGKFRPPILEPATSPPTFPPSWEHSAQPEFFSQFWPIGKSSAVAAILLVSDPGQCYTALCPPNVAKIPFLRLIMDLEFRVRNACPMTCQDVTVNSNCRNQVCRFNSATTNHYW